MALSRRQFTTTAAWSVPVIAVAAATPAAAASTTSFDAQVQGMCLSAGVPGSVYAAFRITALTAAPIPAGQLITITMADPDNGGQLTVDSVFTATSGGTNGITSINVSADQTTWTATTTREIASDNEMNLYISSVGFSTLGETATCTIASGDSPTGNNSSTITRVSLNDGLCTVA